MNLASVQQLASAISGYNLLPWQWGAVLLCALCIGMAKTGFQGITTIMIPVMALIFGAKESTGVILPMLCFADLLAVIVYRRNAEWKYLGALIPWALGGFGLALLVDRFIPARLFKILIAICILFGLLVMIWNDLKKKKPAGEQGEVREPGAEAQTPAPAGRGLVNRKTKIFSVQVLVSAFWGIMGGFTTMIGNAAGPIMSVFLLSKRLPKEAFVGTAAWFFMIVNYLKLPLQHFAWHNIRREGLILNALMIPVIILGAILGILVVKKVSEAHFRIIIYVLTILSSVLLFL
jgi:uncharacterized membrane protein YfcA